eukprot:7377813-Prymnesium_polylepis.1
MSHVDGEPCHESSSSSPCAAALPSTNATALPGIRPRTVIGSNSATEGRLHAVAALFPSRSYLSP